MHCCQADGCIFTPALMRQAESHIGQLESFESELMAVQPWKAKQPQQQRQNFAQLDSQKNWLHACQPYSLAGKVLATSSDGGTAKIASVQARSTQSGTESRGTQGKSCGMSLLTSSSALDSLRPHTACSGPRTVQDNALTEWTGGRSGEGGRQGR
jgi:hypothetical protein